MGFDVAIAVVELFRALECDSSERFAKGLFRK